MPVDVDVESLSRPQWSPNSHYFKETSKWDRKRSQGGMRPDSFEEYPRMVYKARRKEDGAPYRVTDPNDEQFSKSCQLTVNNEAEFERASRDGWRPSPAEALEYVQKQGDLHALAAAHRAHEDRNMSEAAKAEARAAEESTDDHVAEVVEKPRARRQRA